jgi:hypothetical protein
MKPQKTILLIIKNALTMEEVTEWIGNYLPAVRLIGKCYTVEDGIMAKNDLRPTTIIIETDEITRQDIRSLKAINYQDCKWICLPSGQQSRKALPFLPWSGCTLETTGCLFEDLKMLYCNNYF